MDEIVGAPLTRIMLPAQQIKPYAQAQMEVRRLGMTISQRDGEYRINFLAGREATAYYASDLQDAVQTAIVMTAARDSNRLVADETA